jgi:hypothetical protein
MPLTHVVVRPFRADRALHTGEKVDASAWLNVPQLVDQGLIKPIAGAGAGAVAAGDSQASLGEILRRLGLLERAFNELGAKVDALGAATEDARAGAARIGSSLAPARKTSRRKK